MFVFYVAPLYSINEQYNVETLAIMLAVFRCG